MTEIKPGRWPSAWQGPQGTYRVSASLPGWRGAKVTFSAWIACPNCGRAASLSDHVVADDGSVTPSVVCPGKQCGFHEMVKLLGWKEEVKKKRIDLCLGDKPDEKETAVRIRVTKECSGLPVGHEATVIKRGAACGLSGVPDGEEIYLVKSPMPFDEAERAIMQVIASQFPEAREHMDEGIRIDCVPVSHAEVIDGSEGKER